MFVYSQSIFRFVQEIKLVIRNILTTEAHFRCTEHRFYDRFQMRSFPIDVVIYNHRSMLGYFDAGFYELGFHESLMHAKKELLHNVIRHELAHYITFIEYGSTAEPHSAQFLKICQRLGWGENVSRAAMRYNPEETKEEEDGVLRKVKKLMALGASAQTHEAEQAMIKSQQLLLKHNLEARSAESLGETKVWMQRILKQKKRNGKNASDCGCFENIFCEYCL